MFVCNPEDNPWVEVDALTNAVGLIQIKTKRNVKLSSLCIPMI